MTTDGQAHRRRGERVAIVLVGAITLVGLALRLPSFGDSLFGDELSAYFIVAHHSFGAMMHLLSNHSTELNPPLFFIFAWVSQKLLGLSAESLKLVSLLAGTATIPLTYALGRWTVGSRAGIGACALVALCPFMIFYSTEARPYALLVLLVLLSTLALMRALSSPGWWWWGAYALFACAAAYTHFTSVFPLAAQFLWAMVTQPAARRGMLLATAAAAVCYLPWLPVLIKTSRSKGTALYELLDPFSLHTIRIDLGHWAIGHPYLPLSKIPGSSAALLAAAAVVVALVGGALKLASRLRRKPVSKPSAQIVLVAVLALSDPVGAALYSSLRESVWGSRNVIASWPGFAVALGVLVSYPRVSWRAPATGLLLLAFAIGGASMVPQTYHRPDYQSAIAYIDHTDPRGGPIADLPAPTPGPPTETEAALQLAGSSKFHPVFRIGTPTLKSVLAAAPYASLPLQSGELVAHDVASATGDGLLFIVAPTSIPLAELESVRRRHFHSSVSEAFATFLGALPPRLRPESARTFPGLAPVTVYIYRR
jgi:mannosyltransferase